MDDDADQQESSKAHPKVQHHLIIITVLFRICHVKRNNEVGVC